MPRECGSLERPHLIAPERAFSGQSIVAISAAAERVCNSDWLWSAAFGFEAARRQIGRSVP